MKYTLIIAYCFIFIVSCTSNESEDITKSIEETQTIITVACEHRSVALDADNIDKQYPGDVDPIQTVGFEDNSLLYFSQMGPEKAPNFTDPGEYEKPYQYIYIYKRNDAAIWEDEYNFNFRVKDDRKAFDWNTVKEIGSVGNSFSMYAFYFPIDNEIRFNVEWDQRGPEDNKYDIKNFQRSDIMGAYHATSSLFSRLRFRLFHLMTYLKVTLYVPVYHDAADDKGNSYSGFEDDAMIGAFINNVSNAFNVEWRANRSSDTNAPLIQPDNTQKGQIIMYQHKREKDNIIKDFNPKDYYTGENVAENDDVRAYNFSVLFPAQTLDENYLWFVLKTPDNTYKYYYFSGTVGDKNANYGLTQGTLQQLYLYLPRKTNETVLIGAKILPWSNSLTDMTVTKDNKTDNN